MPPLGLPLTLRGQSEPLYLRLDINALTLIEGQAQQGLQRMLRSGMVLSALRLVLWAGARSAKDPTSWRGKSDPDWSLAAAGELLQAHLDAGGTLEELQSALEEALNLGQGPPPAPASPPPAPSPSASATG